MDDELRILSRVDIPTALSALDDRIIHALGVRRHEAAAMRRVMALSAFISLGGGIIAGTPVSQRGVPAARPSRLVRASVLAPPPLRIGHKLPSAPRPLFGPTDWDSTHFESSS